MVNYLTARGGGEGGAGRGGGSGDGSGAAGVGSGGGKGFQRIQRSVQVRQLRTQQIVGKQRSDRESAALATSDDCDNNKSN